MTDPVSTTLAAPRFALGAGAAEYQAADRPRPHRRVGQPVVRARRPAVVERSAGRRDDRRAAWLARCAGPFHRADRRPRRVRRRGGGRGLHDGRRGRDGRQQPRPGRPASDVRQPRRLPRPAHPRLDRSGLRVGDARRPRSDADARHHRLEVRHDDRAERVPDLRLGTRGDGAEQPFRITATSTPAPTSRRSPTRARAPRSSPTTTTSARCSSIRPTSAVATRR